MYTLKRSSVIDKLSSKTKAPQMNSVNEDVDVVSTLHTIHNKLLTRSKDELSTKARITAVKLIQHNQALEKENVLFMMENNAIYRDFESYKQIIYEQSQVITAHVKEMRHDLDEKKKEISKLTKRVIKYQQESGIVLETSDEEGNDSDDDVYDKIKTYKTVSSSIPTPKSIKRNTNRLYALRKNNKNKKQKV